MPKITRFPFFGKKLFRRCRKCKLVGSCHFEHSWRAVVALGAMQGRRNLDRMEDALAGRHSRQAISYFLSQADWDAPELLWEKDMLTLTQLGYQPGDALYLLLDDTQKRKRGKRMAAFSKIFLHAEKI